MVANQTFWLVYSTVDVSIFFVHSVCLWQMWMSTPPFILRYLQVVIITSFVLQLILTLLDLTWQKRWRSNVAKKMCTFNAMIWCSQQRLNWFRKCVLFGILWRTGIFYTHQDETVKARQRECVLSIEITTVVGFWEFIYGQVDLLRVSDSVFWCEIENVCDSVFRMTLLRICGFVFV